MMEIELDDDGWWTVWEDGDHIAMLETQAEAQRWVDNLRAIEAIDRSLFGEPAR